MAFTLDPGTSIPDAVRTAAEEELGQVVKALTGQAELGRDEAAHEARKPTKKLRALLRLVRRKRIKAEAVLAEAAQTALLHGIDERRAELQGRAIVLGRRLVQTGGWGTRCATFLVPQRS